MIKVSFNVTKVSFTLVTLKDGVLTQQELTETLQHKRTEKNVENHLNKLVKEKKAVGYSIGEIKIEKVSCSIPYDVAIKYEDKADEETETK